MNFYIDKSGNFSLKDSVGSEAISFNYINYLKSWILFIPKIRHIDNKFIFLEN